MVAAVDDSRFHPSRQRVRDVFRAKFGTLPSGIFRAPGRVNLIGEHTDYNGGFVMPAALEFSTFAAIGPRCERKLVVYSENFAEMREFELGGIYPGLTCHWSDYVAGVVAVLEKQAGPLCGANLVIHGEVPIGAGLSSSAALEIATALAVLANSGMEMDAIRMAQYCQRAENDYTGANCGIMDQFVACFGRRGHALLLDCRTLQYELLAIPAGVTLVICNSRVRHELAAGEYNHRRADCEDSVRRLRRVNSSITALRDVSGAERQGYREVLPEVAYRRTQHVVTENARVQVAAQALRQGDLNRLGALMYASHRSLRDLYEVSCRELDLLVELAAGMEGVYGARMTGGGFGGCTINLVSEEATAEVQGRLEQEYESRTGIKPEVYVCAVGDGATAVENGKVYELHCQPSRLGR